MKPIIFITAALVVAATGAAAQADMGSHGDKNKVIGGYFSPGIGMVAGDGYEEWQSLNVDREDRTAIFSVGGAFYFDYYFTPIIGIEAGLGFLTKGIRFAPARQLVVLPLNSLRERALFMEIPVSFKVDIYHFQIAVGFALYAALSGKITTETDSSKTDTRYESDQWDAIHRANIGPRIAFAYAIPVGPVYIVPGLVWMIHLINDLNNDEIPGNDNFQMRATNLMFTIGVEWGF